MLPSHRNTLTSPAISATLALPFLFSLFVLGFKPESNGAYAVNPCLRVSHRNNKFKPHCYVEEGAERVIYVDEKWPEPEVDANEPDRSPKHYEPIKKSLHLWNKLKRRFSRTTFA